MGSISTKLIILPPPHAPLLSRTARHHPVPCMDSTTVPSTGQTPLSPLRQRPVLNLQCSLARVHIAHCFSEHTRRGEEGGRVGNKQVQRSGQSSVLGKCWGGKKLSLVRPSIRVPATVNTTALSHSLSWGRIGQKWELQSVESIQAPNTSNLPPFPGQHSKQSIKERTRQDQGQISCSSQKRREGIKFSK